MERKKLGKRINMTRKDRGFTSDRLSELCHISATYLRQIESGVKMPSLPIFISICNILKISPDYLLQDILVENEVSRIKELTELWESTSPSQQEIAATMIQAVLERKHFS
ncbi:MAG: helix-turn-helix transcriptional regulator [Lachnospiraceae bacterium]|jgi:transcriptional regulator with XRE-family HTH domain|nr:helix-turn-helix transcriptional regulator [Lachnospiraceae bacterium]